MLHTTHNIYTVLSYIPPSLWHIILLQILNNSISQFFPLLTWHLGLFSQTLTIMRQQSSDHCWEPSTYLLVLKRRLIHHRISGDIVIYYITLGGRVCIRLLVDWWWYVMDPLWCCGGRVVVCWRFGECCFLL